MANPTTNFGWVMPTSTSLVTNLPADFNTFGQGVDTSMAQLKGGTTGQVLSKTSATDMAFTWITPSSLSSPLTTKGDLWTYTTTNARLAVGNNGESLVADSAATSGLRWTATPSASNPVLNSAFQIWQRGTSISLAASAGTTFLADRWCVQTGTNQACTVSRQATGDTTNLPFIQYAMRFQRNSGQTGTGALGVMQPMETINTVPFANKTVTLSFYARKGADYSATSSALLAYLRTGTGTDQNPYSGYTGDNTSINTTATLTTTWQRFSVTGTLGATVTEMTVQFGFTPTGTASTNDYYEVTGVQIDVGNVALPFRTNGGTIQGELAACQRYYYKTYPQSVTPGTATNYIGSATGTALTTAAMITPVRYAVTMRTTPTITIYHQDGTVNAVYYILTAAKVTVTGSSFASDGGFWQIDAASTLVAGAVYYWHYTASAEL